MQLAGRTLAIGALALAATTAAPQQTPPTQQAQVFRAGVDLIALDVTVVDRDGAPVKDLAADAFVVRINGERRAVRALEFIEFGKGAGTVAVAGPSSNTGAGATRASQGGRVIVLLFDDLSLGPGDAEGLTIAAERVLTSLDDDDLVGLTTTSGMGPVVSPTRDRAAITAALRNKRLVGSYLDLSAPYFVTIKEAVDIDDSRRDALAAVVDRECQPPVDRSTCVDQIRSAARRVAVWAHRRSEMQLDAMKQTIDAMTRAPKPRVVIALSNGLSLGSNRTYSEELDPITRAAANAEVQFYALAEVGDVIDITAARQPLPGRFGLNDRASAKRAENDYLLSGIQTVATAAGGEAFKVVGQADRFFRRIYRETSGVYRLGAESGPIKPGEAYLDVKVSVDRPDMTVRAHRHALVPGAAAVPEPIEQQLRNRLAQGGIAFGVPVAVATAVRAGNDGTIRVAVDAQMAAASGPLTALFGLVDTRGVMVQTGRRELPAASQLSDYRAAFDLPVAPGGYRLRFVVADAAGNIGAVQHEVNATLTRFGRVQVSDVLLTSIGADGQARFLALDALPATATSLRAALEIYPDQRDAVGAVGVQFALLRADSATVVTTRDLVPTDVGGVLTTVATLPVAGLQPAAYLVRFTVLDGGTEVGALMAPFRLSPSVR